MDIQYDFDRFVTAQDAVYETALAELKAGRKKSHWMWYIFPQIEGLGVSQTSAFYAISGKDEAKAYLAHPVLGPRLIECTKATLPHADRGGESLFGQPDYIKFQSCLSLFSRAKPCDPVFETALNAFFGGVACQPTLETLRIAFYESLSE
jgi:uncharacterized protein (DUF1810 family)